MAKELDIVMKSKINSLASVLSGFEGFEADPNFDFSKTENPRAREMWNRAIVVIAHLYNDPLLINHCIKRRKS